MPNPDDITFRLDQIDERRLALARRLEDGYARIELALASGQDVSQWETFWVDLLHQYETLSDQELVRAA